MLIENLISDNDISFVIQGPVTEVTVNIVNNIKNIFPHSPIIIATTSKVSDVNIIADDLVLTDDPGFFYYSKEKNDKANNVNRQIVSTVAGLKKVKTKYCFKLRSDFYLNGDGFLKYFFKYSENEAEYKIFKSKILACCYFTRVPTSKMPYPFHISDLVFFGNTEDLLNLYDVPLMKEEDAYCIDKIKRNRYFPEQHILINCIKKHNKVLEFEYYEDIRVRNIIETEKYFASNFILLSFDQFNLKPTKNTFSKSAFPESFSTCYTHVEWQALYKKHVDPNFKIKSIDRERLLLNYYDNKIKRKRLLANIISSFAIIPTYRRMLRKAILNSIR